MRVERSKGALDKVLETKIEAQCHVQLPGECGSSGAGNAAERARGE